MALLSPATIGQIAALANANANGNSGDLVNATGKGLNLYINISAISGTGATLTVTIQGKDPVSGQYFNILASAGLTATGFTRLLVYPGAPLVANASDPDVIPDTWRVSWTITGTTPQVTATISGCLFP